MEIALRNRLLSALIVLLVLGLPIVAIGQQKPVSAVSFNDFFGIFSNDLAKRLGRVAAPSSPVGPAAAVAGAFVTTFANLERYSFMWLSSEYAVVAPLEIVTQEEEKESKKTAIEKFVANPFDVGTILVLSSNQISFIYKTEAGSDRSQIPMPKVVALEQNETTELSLEVIEPLVANLPERGKPPENPNLPKTPKGEPYLLHLKIKDPAKLGNLETPGNEATFFLSIDYLGVQEIFVPHKKKIRVFASPCFAGVPKFRSDIQKVQAEISDCYALLANVKAVETYDSYIDKLTEAAKIIKDSDSTYIDDLHVSATQEAADQKSEEAKADNQCSLEEGTCTGEAQKTRAEYDAKIKEAEDVWKAGYSQVDKYAGYAITYAANAGDSKRKDFYTQQQAAFAANAEFQLDQMSPSKISKLKEHIEKLRT